MPLLIAACASSPVALQYQHAQSASWPVPPDRVRFVYVGELSGASNFSETTSSNFLKKAWFVLTGVLLGGDQRSSLQRPSSGYTDVSAGRVYVTDVGRKGVFVFDQAEGHLRFWDAASAKHAFQTPIAISQGVNGELWVTDADLSVVVRLDSDGEPLGWVGESVLQRPTGIVFDSTQSLMFVADAAAHNIQVFNASGTLVRTIGQRGEGPGQFNGPTHLAIDGDRLLVTDTLNSRVQILSLRGEFISSFGTRGMYIGNMPRPKGVAVDGAGHIYVVESYYDYLLVYDAEGRLLLPMGGSGKNPGQFYLPAGVWTDGDKRIFVADMFNGRVVSFDYVGDAQSDSPPPENNHNTGG
ncbi:MAG: 6-bladed beta-propeller [Gammaproteobacteria bacterium]|nr:6-bladed beta-propeller [Gammaproteobacteria bacterium]